MNFPVLKDFIQRLRPQNGQQIIWDSGSFVTSLYQTIDDAKRLIQQVHTNPKSFYEAGKNHLKLDLDFTADLKTRQRALSQIEVAVSDDSGAIMDSRMDWIRDEVKRLAPVATRAIQASIWDGLSPRMIQIEHRNDRNVITGLPALPKHDFGFIDGALCTIGNQWNPWNSRVPLRGNGYFQGGEDWDQRFFIFCPTFQFNEPERDEEYYGGLAQYILVTQALQGFVEKNYLSFSELFGKPIRYAKVNGTVSEKERAEIRRALRDVGDMLSGVIPDGADLQILELADKGGSVSLFDNLIRMFKQNKTKMVLGTSEMTSTQPNGTRARTETLDRLRQDVLYEDIDRANGFLTELIQKLYVANFEPNAHFSQIPLRAEYIWQPPKDLTEMAQIISTLAKNPEAAARIPARVVNELFPIPVPEEGEATLRSATSTLDIFQP